MKWVYFLFSIKKMIYQINFSNTEMKSKYLNIKCEKLGACIFLGDN